MSLDPVAQQIRATAEHSALWLIQQIEVEAGLEGRPLTDWDRWVLRTGPREFTEDHRPHVATTHNRSVELVRKAIVRAKKQGAPVVRAREGLTIPIEWEEHYEVIYNTELPWMVSAVMQSAFLGNPVVGETQPWRSEAVISDRTKRAVGWGAVGAVAATLLGLG